MYSVDLEELAQSIDEMARCGGDLDALLDEIDRSVARLHLTWSGAASSAQAAAQAEWETGFREMREALTVMRAAADRAHGNYSSAVATNVRMWEQVR